MAKIKSAVFSVALLLTVFLTLAGANVFFSYAGEDTGKTATASDLWKAENGITLQNNVDVPDYMKYGSFIQEWDRNKVITVDENSENDYLEEWEKNGMLVSSSVTDSVIEFKNTVNISDFTTNDVLLAFSPLTATRGIAEYTQTDIKLIDAEDESNYLLISVAENPNGADLTKIAVSTPQIGPLGYLWGDKNEVHPNGFTKSLNISYSGYTQDSGSVVGETCRHRSIKLHYDYAEKMVSVTGPRGQLFYVLDLDDGHAVGYGSEWQGFTSGRVKMAITLSGFRSNRANMLVLNAFGTPMNGAALTDSEHPLLVFDEAAEHTPLACVGKPYPLFAYSCDDTVSGALDCKVEIVAPDGESFFAEGMSFVPQQSGYYTLRYTATDAAGNAAERTFLVLSQNVVPSIVITEREEYNESYKVGDEIEVYEANLAGGAGMLMCEKAVYYENANEIVIENGAFVPRAKGKYHIRYTVTDYIGNVASKTVVVDVADNGFKPVVKSFEKPEIFYDGVATPIPYPVAYDFISKAGVRRNAQVLVTAYNRDKTHEKKVENGIFTPDKEKFGDSVTLFYKVFCEGYEEYAEGWECEVPLHAKPESSAGYLNVENGSTNVEKSSVSITPAADECAVSFALPLDFTAFQVRFAVFVASKSSAPYVVISLCDSEDSSSKIDMKLTPITEGYDKDGKTFVFSGGKRYAMNGTFNKTGAEVVSSLTLRYHDGRIVDYNGNTVFTPVVTSDGKPFTGFAGNKIKLKIVFGGGIESLSLSSVNNQPMGSIGDTVKPEIVLSKQLPEKFYMNQTVHIPYAYATDALSPYMETKVTLIAPDGEKLFDNVSSEEGMSFVIEREGYYRLTYSAYDNSGKQGTVMRTIYAGDYEAPTIVYPYEGAIEGKVGKSVQLPSVIVQDNRDKNPKLFVFICLPDGRIIGLGERTEENRVDSFIPESKGNYIVRYYATDASGNSSYTDLEMNVL